MLIKATDFESPPYKFPNQKEFAGGFLAFKEFIADEERKLLESILGIALYDEFMEALDSSGELEEKWANLLDGATYEANDVTYRYRGLVDLLVPGVFSKLLPIGYRKSTSSGVIINKGQQNTETQDPTFEIVTAWNEYAVKVGDGCHLENSLYGFMKANEDDYESWVFTDQPKKNQLDL